MNRASKLFVGVSYLVSYACFIPVVLSRIAMADLPAQPLYLVLLLAGCLGPLLAVLLVHLWDRGERGGLPGLKTAVATVADPKAGWLVLLFLLLHFGLSLVLGAARLEGNAARFLIAVPVAFVVFGTQEIGWRAIVLPSLQETRRLWKATVATGLLQALWFLPLFFIPGFFVRADFYLQFAVYITGYGLLQTTIYKKSGGILFSILFATAFFALSTVLVMQQTSLLFAVAAIDVVLAFLYNSKRAV